MYEHMEVCEDYKNFLVIKKKYICEFCKKSYSKNSNLRRHQKKCKKRKKATKEQTELIQFMSQQMEKQNQQMEKQNQQMVEQKIYFFQL